MILMKGFSSKDELILFVLDLYYFGSVYQLSFMRQLSDSDLAQEIKKLTRGEMELYVENKNYFLR